eukprot:scaffold28327_cov22-Tisochrysis_lutea.AAC.1
MHRSYDLYVGLQIKFISLDSTWALRGYAAIPGEESFKPDSDIGTILSKLVEKRIWMRASPVKGKRASSVFMRLSLRTYAGGAGQCYQQRGWTQRAVCTDTGLMHLTGVALLASSSKGQ